MISMFKNMDERDLQSIQDVDSQYPPGLDFTPGTELHDTIVQMVNNCAERGKSVTDGNVKQYEGIDNGLDCFMRPDEMDRRRKGKDDRKPVNIVIPTQFANLDIFRTAMHKAFFSDRYIHRYRGIGTPESAANAAIANQVVDRIGGWFGHRRSLDILWSDCFAYGRGWMWGKWSKKKAPRFDQIEIDELSATIIEQMGGSAKPGDVIRTLSEDMVVTKEGTEWINLDPYQVFTDPSVTPDRFQDSEFFGWAARTDALILMDLEEDPEEQLFNTKALPLLTRQQSTSRYYREEDPPQNVLTSNTDEWRGDTSCSTIDVVYMMCRIIPANFNLGDSKKPSIWMFAVAGDCMLIKAHQLKTKHGGYPVVCGAPNARGHHVAPVSHLMITQGIASSIDYHVKRRHDFIDTAYNGKYVIDPSKLEYKDFRDADGPTIIRMKKSAFGAGKISDWFHELPVNDVTANTWGDVSSLLAMSKEGSGIQDLMLGSGGNLPERPTATGIEALQGGAISRLTRAAIILDEQVHRPKGEQDICNAAQWLAMDMVIDIIGKDEEVIRDWYNLPEGATGLTVNGWDIDPELDVVAMSSVSQGAKSYAALAELGKSIMPAFMAQPGATQAMIPFVSQLMKESGIDDWDYVTATVMPDQQVAAMQQSGELQPMRTAAV